MISGLRVRQVRELYGWTQTDLARDLGIRQASLAQIEAGEFQPSTNLVEAIATKTGFPPAFFGLEVLDDFSLGSLVFRARASTTNRQRMEAFRFGQIVYELASRLAGKVTAIPPRLPRVNEPPQIAASLTRSALGLPPDTPIPSLIRTLERNGVWIVRLPVSLESRDAFSQWVGPERRRPIIFLAGSPPGDRLRFSTCHELGHLVRDSSMRGQVVDIEREADQFAAEFLMPELGIRQDITVPVTLNSFAGLKRRWGVALQALIRRAFDLEIITKRQYQRLFETIGARGWRTQEPEALGVPIEHPRTLRKMAEVGYGDPINYRKLAKDSMLSVEFIKRVIEAQAERPQARPENRKPGRVVPLRLP